MGTNQEGSKHIISQLLYVPETGLSSNLMSHLGCLCLLKLSRKTGQQNHEKGCVWVKATGGKKSTEG